MRALERVRQHRTALKVLPGGGEVLPRPGGRALPGRGRRGTATCARPLRDPDAAQALYDDREVSALLRNTISITVVKAGYKTNVIPGTAEAELDVRLLPGRGPAGLPGRAARRDRRPHGRDRAARRLPPPNASPTDTELFRVIERVLGRHFPGVPVTTKMLAGATESVLFRPLGIVAYGFTPLLTTSEEIATAHGDDERIQEATVRRRWASSTRWCGRSRRRPDGR